jgi:hypothetical protein
LINSQPCSVDNPATVREHYFKWVQIYRPPWTRQYAQAGRSASRTLSRATLALHVVDHLRMQRSRRPWSGQHVGEISPRTMPSSRKVNLEKVQASLDAVCPKCGRMIPPAEVRRIDFERIECPECCARPDESLAPRLFLRVQRSSRPPPPPLLPLVCSCGGWDELLSS